MGASLQVDKREWESFLAEFAELTKRYELLLSKLDVAERKRGESMVTVADQPLMISNRLRQVRSAIEKLSQQTEDALNDKR